MMSSLLMPLVSPSPNTPLHMQFNQAVLALDGLDDVALPLSL